MAFYEQTGDLVMLFDKTNYEFLDEVRLNPLGEARTGDCTAMFFDTVNSVITIAFETLDPEESSIVYTVEYGNKVLNFLGNYTFSTGLARPYLY
jgi:hypothetical protein